MNQVATNTTQSVPEKKLPFFKLKIIGLSAINSVIWVLVFISVLNFVAQTHPIKKPNLAKLIAAFSLALTSGYVTTKPLRRLKAKLTEAN